MLIVKEPGRTPPTAVILVIRGGHRVIVDPDRLEMLKKFNWFLLKSASTSYVCARRIVKGKAYTVRMHRLLMNCPSWLKVHHVNHDSLDNRVDNLQVITEREHRHFDGWHIFEH